MKNQKNILISILQSFNERQINYCLLRAPGNSIDNETELDILIWPDSLKQAHTILIQHRCFLWKKRDFLKKRVYACYGQGMLLQFDVHLAFVQNGIVYMAIDGIKDRLEKDSNGFNILSKEDQLLHYFFHNLLGKEFLQAKHLVSVKNIIGDSIEWEYLFSKLKSKKIEEIFRQFLSEPESFAYDNSATRQKVTLLKKEITRYNINNRLRVLLRNFLLRFLYRKHGVHFAFIGVDGSGKSSLIDALEHKLNLIKGVKYKVVYMGPWGHSKSKLHKWVLRKRITLPKEKEAKQISKFRLFPEKAKFFVKGTIYYLSIYYELWYRYLKFVRPRLRKGQIVLSDRYIYDLRYIYKKRAVKGFRFLRYFICAFFPKPDRIVYLFNTPETIVNRKPQLNEEQIRLFQTYYSKALVAYRPLKILTNDSPDAIADRVGEEIIKNLLQANAK